MLRHPGRNALDRYLRHQDSGAAGLLLHILRCEECAARAVGGLLIRRQEGD